MNPYGLHSASQADSDTSSDRLSQFETACEYPDFDMRNDLNWYDHEKDEDQFMTPCFSGSDFYDYQVEDKFVTTSMTEKHHDNTLSPRNESEGFRTEASIDYLDNEVQLMNCYHFDKCNGVEAESDQELKNCVYGCSLPLHKSSEGPDFSDENPMNFSCLDSKETDFNDLQLQATGDINAGNDNF